jgi:predicted DNA-binding protein (MmcQ/YjbR family)
MTLEDLQAICKKFPGVTEDIKWENHLCFCVGEKMFLVTSLDENPPSCSFKASEEEFEELSVRDGFKPAPYMARHKWVFTDDINRMKKKEWEHYAKESYRLVSSKLPAAMKKKLGIK